MEYKAEGKPWDKEPTGVHRGNWQEELVLEKETGIRFYPDPRDKKTSLMTTQRCIIHSERTEPKDWNTVNRDTFLIPSNHRDFISSDGKGPRQRAYEARLKQQVADELRTKEEIAYAEKMAPRFETESTSNFAKDGFETKSLEGPKRLLTFNAEYANEEAVTYYSHSVRCGKSNFPATFMPSGQQLFAKNSSFSADINQPYVKIAETHERPGHPARAKDYLALKGLAQRMIDTVKSDISSSDATGTSILPGSAVQKIVLALDTMGSETPMLSIEIFEQSIQSVLNFTFTNEERTSLLTEFDQSKNGQISCAEFLLLVRPSMSPRRLELIDIAFGIVDTNNKGTVNKRDVESCIMNGNNVVDGINKNDLIASFIASLFGGEGSRSSGNNDSLSAPGVVGFEDFVEYFSNISREVEDDMQFEIIVKCLFSL